MRSGGTPGPLSSTVTTASRPSGRTVVVTIVPAGVCLRAFDSRLAKTWCSWNSSARTMSGASGRLRRHVWSRLETWASETALSTTSLTSTSASSFSRPASRRASRSMSSTSEPIRCDSLAMRVMANAVLSLSWSGRLRLSSE